MNNSEDIPMRSTRVNTAPFSLKISPELKQMAEEIDNLGGDAPEVARRAMAQGFKAALEKLRAQKGHDISA